MAKAKYVEISKGEHKGRCTEESVPAWEAHGWTVVEDGSSSEPVQQQAEETAKPEVEPQQRRTETKE